MARIGGRNLWLAWPAGLVCAGVVGALVWLAAPAVPGTVRFAGDMLRARTSAPIAAAATPIATMALDGTVAVDCLDMYPASLWRDVAWTDAVLSQNHAAPATAVTALVDALQPTVRVTCVWHGSRGTIATTLSVVATDASAVADVALRGQGFACEPFGSGIACRRASGGVVEEHAVRDGLWLASVETSWHPEDYGTRLALFVWG